MKLRIEPRYLALFGSCAFLLAACAFWLPTSTFWLVNAVDAIGARQARELIQKIAGANFTKEQVQIKNISGGVGPGGAIVEAQIETAFRFTKGKDGWRITEARLGAGQWESFELIEEGVRREKIRRTTALLQQIADGIGAYKNERGQFVEAEEIAKLLDVLSPRYVNAPRRFDLWGGEFKYHGSAAGYRLFSPGPDRKSGTTDDLIIENGQLKSGAD